MIFTFYFVTCKFLVLFIVEPVDLGETTNMPALALSSSFSKKSKILTLFTFEFHNIMSNNFLIRTECRG